MSEQPTSPTSADLTQAEEQTAGRITRGYLAVRDSSGVRRATPFLAAAAVVANPAIGIPAVGAYAGLRVGQSAVRTGRKVAEEVRELDEANGQ